jgi:hypothetical protein
MINKWVKNIFTLLPWSFRSRAELAVSFPGFSLAFEATVMDVAKVVVITAGTIAITAGSTAALLGHHWCWS